MSKNILDRKIPSLAGLGILVVGIIVTTFLVKGPTPFQIRANPSSDPQNILVTNISDSSFTVVYITVDSVIGTITYGENPDSLDKVNLDDRDQLSQKINEYKAHSITVNNIAPNTQYYFTISSDGKTIKDNGQPFTAKTGPTISSSPSTQIPLAGKAISPDGKNISDGIIIVETAGSQKISGIFRENGNYTIPLNNLRTADLSNYFNLDENSVITLNLTSENYGSIIELSKNQLSPVPIVTLSKDYDFSKSNNQFANTKRERDVSFPEFDSEIRTPSITPVPTKTQTL